MSLWPLKTERKEFQACRVFQSERLWSESVGERTQHRTLQSCHRYWNTYSYSKHGYVACSLTQSLSLALSFCCFSFHFLILFSWENVRNFSYSDRFYPFLIFFYNYCHKSHGVQSATPNFVVKTWFQNKANMVDDSSAWLSLVILLYSTALLYSQTCLLQRCRSIFCNNTMPITGYNNMQGLMFL